MTTRRLDDWSARDLRAVAAEHGTPTYVQDLDRVRANYERLDDAFPDARIHYAVKANAGRAVLKALREVDAGAEAASAGEVARALDAGFDPSEIHYTPVNPPDRDLDPILNGPTSGLTVTVGSRDLLDRLDARGFDGRVCLRVHPGVGAGHSEDVATGADAKFGVPAEDATTVLREADARGFDVVGVHAHVGSGMLTEEDVEAHREVVEVIAGIARDSPVDLEFVDVGGGFGVPYRESEEALDLDAVANATRDALADVDADLVVEPGRYLVADAGVLLAEVVSTKPTGDAVVAGADAGMTELLRPALYDAYHPIRSLARDAHDRPTRTVTVVGPVCESTDVLADARDLPRPAVGDLLAVGNAGAYGIEMASNYTSRPRPPVVAVEGDDTRIVRERETMDDLLRFERD
ncbi:diaminopimelate decarboxylase [Halocalculus aciditolerans]|uniref:Diaminopimelate decarboxylase n=1 Tax=Halocalculus aciditolerans TaxID=1383812 RepID=A0A830F4S4_9EURY|nr:diaminopimelate decarboxylase [Halocalculus aciditolerans]GGL62890.1 diaminopimelate decarboxylase [Halocalculus aciditolerans]